MADKPHDAEKQQVEAAHKYRRLQAEKLIDECNQSRAEGDEIGKRVAIEHGIGGVPQTEYGTILGTGMGMNFWKVALDSGKTVWVHAAGYELLGDGCYHARNKEG